MAFTETHLGQATVSNSSPTTIYTCPALTKAIVRDIMFTNVTASDATITLWIDPDGSTADDTTAQLKSWTIPGNDFAHWTGYKILSATGTVKGQSNTASAITVTVDGATVT